MAIQEDYTLDDFRDYAHDNFPLAFELVSDQSAYKFKAGRFHTEDGSVSEGDLLQVAYWNGRTHGIPVWAYCDGEYLRYFYGKPGTTMTPAPPPYPSSGYTPIRDFLGPFSFVADRTWPSSKSKAYPQARTLCRNRLALLIMFIFLLTGRISEIANPARHDLTLLFKYVCVHMQQNKEAEEEEKRKKEEHERKLKEAALARTAFEVAGHISAQVNVKEENLETNMSMLDMAYDQSIRNDSAERSASATPSIVFRSSKRAAVHMSDDSAEPESQHTHKRARLTPAHSHIIELASPITPYPQVQSILESLVQQCRAEIESESSAQGNSSQEEIAQLRVELVDQTKKTVEAEKKFEEQEDIWQEHHEQQGTMIVNLQVEVKEWKDKYQKQGTTAVNREVEVKEW